MAPRTWAKMARGEVGLGFGAARHNHQKTRPAHRKYSRSLGGEGQREAEQQGVGGQEGALNPDCVFSAKAHFSRPGLCVFQVMPCSGIPRGVNMSLSPAEQLPF